MCAYWDRVSLTFCPVVALNHDPPDFCSWVEATLPIYYYNFWPQKKSGSWWTGHNVVAVRATFGGGRKLWQNYQVCLNLCSLGLVTKGTCVPSLMLAYCFLICKYERWKWYSIVLIFIPLIKYEFEVPFKCLFCEYNFCILGIILGDAV
jgi:hypothetical protein